MKSEACIKQTKTMPAMGWIKALLLTLPMLLFTAFFFIGGTRPVYPLQIIAGVITWLFYNLIFFLMLKTGKTDKYRAILFIVGAIGFVIFFGINLLETRGSRFLTAANMVEGKTPFCHMVIPMILIPAALTRTIVFPGSLTEGHTSIAGMLVFWLGATLVMGRGWCSWVCFYGGFDEFFSRLAKKVRIKTIDKRWRYLPWAVLISIVILSMATLSPAYCRWLCPFKTVTENPEVNSPETLAAAIVFTTLFIGLVVVLPYLTKRRTQCGLFCPFGAMQSLTNKLNIFEVRIDRDLCVDCNRCVKVCPTLSIDEETVKSGKTLMSCTKCGSCIDHCPRQAVIYHIKGTSIGLKANTARLLFLYPVFLIMYTLIGGMVGGALWRILKLLFTGSMLL